MVLLEDPALSLSLSISQSGSQGVREEKEEGAVVEERAGEG